MTHSTFNPFADLEGDWEAQLQRDTRETTGHGRDENTVRYPCIKCNGTGVWSGGYRRHVTGKCHACNGKGFFLTSPRQRELNKQAYAKAKTRELNKTFDRATSWAEQNREVYDFLVANKDWSEFYASLLNQLAKKGELSEAQVGAVQKGIRQQKERAEAKAKAEATPAVTIELGAILALFDKAGASGLKKPVLRFSDLSVSKAPATGKNAGYLYVKDQGEYAGKINPEGGFIAGRATRPEVLEQLVEFAKDPEAGVLKYGRITGRCACCGLPLSKEESVQRGVGAICAEKWGF